MAIATRRSPAEKVKDSDAEWRDFVHTGPGTLAGRYLRMFWQPICRSRDLEPAQTKPVRVMGEDYTLYRGEGGTAHLTAFRCAHRGTQLSAAWVEGDHLRCYYHGWKYDATGQCVEQPGEAEPFCERIRIRSCPVQEHIGLIFAYLGEGEPPQLPRYPELEDAEGLLENWYEEWPCNYFNRLENAPDLTHVHFVHHQSGATIPYRIQAVETDYGMQTLTLRTPDQQEWTPGTHFQMPNTNFWVGNPKDPGETGPRIYIMWRVPVDDEHHMILGSQRVRVAGEAAERYLARRQEAEELQQRAPMAEVGSAVLAGKLKTKYIAESRWWDVNSVQDYVTLVGQGAIADREAEHLGQEDVGIVLLRSLYTRELRALAEGKALKPWARQPRPTR